MSAEIAASAADLSYVTDRMSGIKRQRRGKGFSYIDPNGATVKDAATMARIRALAIPPAWTDVWICPDANGHLQATGRDAKGRKQYIYHSDWQEARGGSKYERLVEIARLLPLLRARIEEDLRRPAPSKPRVLATVVRLLETTLIRIGNHKYAKANDSYGLTTLRDEHVEVQGTQMRFEFRGKSGKTWQLAISDRRVANAVRACQELPGQLLFQYVEAGERYAITSNDVNAYLREATGAELSAKDIRTWAGTVMTAVALADAEPPGSPTHAKRVISAAVKQVAARLGNTPTVCRKSYVHPKVLEAFAAGRLTAAFELTDFTEDLELGSEERAVVALLEGQVDEASTERNKTAA